MWIATAEECRDMDRRAEAMGIPVETLMHEAGRAVAACALENYPDAKRIAVICGKGNNGGDGFVAARLLAEHQREVAVLVAASPSELNTNAARECGRLAEVRVEPRFVSGADWDSGNYSLGPYDVLVDALLGTGLAGAPSGAANSAIVEINRSGRPVVAADIPSGVACDSGAVPGEAVSARHTVTFGLPKPFLFQGEGMVRAGEWSVAPIGFPDELLEQPRGAQLTTPKLARRLMPTRSKLTNKHRQGSLLVVAGSRDMPGAAALAARAALRSGAGLATVASIPSVCEAVSRQLPEALFLTLPEKDGAIDPSAADLLKERSDRYRAVVVGPGLGLSSGIGELLTCLFPIKGWRFCIDADALTWIARGVPAPLGDKSVLTPHEGELGRLLDVEPSEIQRDRFAASRAAAAKLGCTVLLKGAYSLVAGPRDWIQVNPTGNPGLAAAGTGDVLAGLIGSILLNHEPWESAVLGAYWHGLAGDLCAAEIGPAGYLASEVADRLPRARATIVSS